MGKNPPFYSSAQRQLQAQFDSEALASRLEELIVQTELDEAAPWSKPTTHHNH